MAYTTIDKSDDYFNTNLWTGTGSTQSITGVNFQPDWLWVKTRSTSANHRSQNSVIGAEYGMNPNQTVPEGYLSDCVTSFDSDGFTLGADSQGYVNTSSRTYVGWSWRGSDSSAVSNTDGSITSTVSANTTSGFSVVTYTGTGANASIGHGLGSVPKFIIVKCRSNTMNWPTYNANAQYGVSGISFLDVSDAEQNYGTSYWQTTPTSSLFYVGSNSNTNNSGYTYVAYVFAEKKGFSKFGIFTGNGSSDGSFAYCGFKPAWVLIKNRDNNGYNWTLHDNKRNAYNLTNRKLEPNTANAEDTVYDVMDFYSNGFKCKTSDPGINASGSVYLYWAFAENPFVTSTGIPACAR